MKFSWLVLADALLTIVTFLLSLVLRFEFIDIGYFLRAIWLVILIGVFVRPLIFSGLGVYNRVWRYATTGDFLRLGIGVILSSIVMSLAAFALYPRFIYTFPRSVLAIEAVLAIILFGGFRIAMRHLERFPGDIAWRKIELGPARRVLIVGAGSAGVQIVKELLSNPQLGLQPVAFMDDDTRKIGRRVQGLPVFGPLVELASVVEEKEIENVIVAIPSAPQQTIQNLKTICEKLPVSYSIMPHLSTLLSLRGEGLSSDTDWRLPMSMPDITGEEIQSVLRVMQSRNLSFGSQTLAFEKNAAVVAGAAHAVAVINGTSALHLCMVAAGVGPGDEVITSPFSFVASANCVLYEHAKPVFIDIDPVSLNLDPTKIEAAITERTRAILPVHIFGQPADMDPILAIAEKYNLLVIEDACEAIGAEYKGRRVGALGKAGAFAFYPNKQMTTGEGAVLVTNDDEWAELFRSLRNQGRDRFDAWLNHSRLGYNYRMSEMNAAVGAVQMRRLDFLLQKRENVAREYNARIRDIPGVRPLTILPTTTRMSWFVYAVRFEDHIDRDDVLDKLAARGIPTRPYFTPIHLQPFYRQRFGYQPGDYPETEKAGRSILALPFYATMKAEEVAMVCDAMKEVLREEVRV